MVEHKEMVFEKLDYPDAGFDLAFGACVLHHVDIPQAMRELSRVMKPGARAVFVENSARNPLLMFARRRMVGSMGIPRYGDDDEHPLRSFPELVAAIALVGVMIIVLAAWQIGAFTNG